MKILQIIQRPQLRGAEIFACQLSVELIQLGNEVDILFLFGKENLPFPLPFYHLKANAAKRFWDIKAFKKIADLIKENQYDIVQANAGDTLKYAAISKFLFHWQAKLIFRNANKLSDFLKNPLQKIVNKFFVKQLDGVISVSELCKQDFISTFKFTTNRICYVPIGVSKPSQNAYTQFLDAGINVPINYKVLIHVGSFVPEKNQMELVNIFSELLTTHPNTILLLIGEGKTKISIQQYVQEKALANHVLFLGARQDVQQILPLCNAFVLPSTIEGLPAVILEAMLAKLPVIAYNVGGISEVVKNEVTGHLIDVNNSKLFVNAVRSCLSNANNAVTNQAFELVNNHYTNPQIALQFQEQYQQFL